jgi:hypothetical protein
VEFPNKLHTPAQFSRVRELIEQPELLAAALDYIASENDGLSSSMHLQFIAVAAKLFEMSRETNANPKNIWYPGSK